MSNKPNWKATFLAVATITALILTSCATPTPEVIEKVVEKVVTQIVKETVIVEGTPQVVEKEVTKVVEVEKEVEVVVTATPEPPGDGNTLAFGQWGTTAPNNFCPLGDTTGMEVIYLRRFLGASLATKNEQGTQWVPDLAENWESSEDGMSWTFTLNPDVTWHDGEPFTADDVVFTFGLMTGGAFPRYGAVFADVVESVETIDDYTVLFTMKYPVYPGGVNEDSIFSKLVSWNPVPAHILADVDAKDICNTAWAQTEEHVNLGPFRVVEFEPDGYAIYVPYEDYYREPSQLDELIIQFASDPQALLVALLDGELAMAQTTPSLVEAVNEHPDLFMAPNASLIAVNAKQTEWPPQDPYVRQSLTEPQGEIVVPYRELLDQLEIGDAFLLPTHSETSLAIMRLREVLGDTRINQARAVTIIDEGETAHWAPTIGPKDVSTPWDPATFWAEVEERGGLVIGTVVIERPAGQFQGEPAIALAVVTGEGEHAIELVGPNGEVLNTFTGKDLLYDTIPPVEIPIAGIERGTRWCWVRILGIWIMYPCGW